MAYLTVKATFTIDFPNTILLSEFNKLSAAEQLQIIKAHAAELDAMLVDGIHEMDEQAQDWLETHVQVAKVDIDTVQLHTEEHDAMLEKHLN